MENGLHGLWVRLEVPLAEFCFEPQGGQALNDMSCMDFVNEVCGQSLKVPVSLWLSVGSISSVEGEKYSAKKKSSLFDKSSCVGEHKALTLLCFGATKLPLCWQGRATVLRLMHDYEHKHTVCRHKRSMNMQGHTLWRSLQWLRLAPCHLDSYKPSRGECFNLSVIAPLLFIEYCVCYHSQFSLMCQVVRMKLGHNPGNDLISC